MKNEINNISKGRKFLKVPQKIKVPQKKRSRIRSGKEDSLILKDFISYYLTAFSAWPPVKSNGILITLVKEENSAKFHKKSKFHKKKRSRIRSGKEDSLILKKEKRTQSLMVLSIKIVNNISKGRKFLKVPQKIKVPQKKRSRIRSGKEDSLILKIFMISFHILFNRIFRLVSHITVKVGLMVLSIKLVMLKTLVKEENSAKFHKKKKKSNKIKKRRFSYFEVSPLGRRPEGEENTKLITF
ncbi:hypothetical protein H8356DRAFT_1357006 [Neocallimastix lanati (nom. inval.)]|nr:hypothetical protein H8356DRAFT_1357006 [Neocallimastix sp. JGI-2020a]